MGDVSCNTVEGHRNEPRMQQRSLTDMPAAVLDQLPLTLFGGDLLALFGTCVSFRDATLRARPIIARHCLSAEPASRQKLHVFFKYCTRACLHLTSGGRLPRVVPPEALAIVQAMAQAAADVLHSISEAPGRGLVTIVDVRLMDLELSGIVPGFLTSNLPNLRRLQLSGCRIHHFIPPPQPPADAIITSASRLEELELALILPQDAPTIIRWTQQLASLVGLNSLAIVPVGPCATASFLQGCSMAFPQLEQLRVGHMVDLSKLRAWFPNLLNLELPTMDVDDEGMEALLSLPHLQQLRVKTFQLQVSYSKRDWTVMYLSVQQLEVDSFDRMPLAGVQLFDAPWQCLIKPSLDPSTNTRVVGAISASGGLGWGWQSVLVEGTEVMAVSVALVAPLLSTCAVPELCIRHVRPVTQQLLTALQQGLRSTVTTIRYIGCSFDNDAWPQVLSSLPAAVMSVVLQECTSPLEEHITAMCVCATRAVSLSVRGQRFKAGAESRVIEAMAARGHKHVTLR